MQQDIVQYFNGRSKNTSKATVETEALQAPEVGETIKAWNLASLDTGEYCPDVDCAWKKVRSKLTDRKKVIALNYFYWAAAGLALILGSYFVFQSSITDQVFSSVTVVKSKAGVREIALPDGTQVWLNVNSGISYSKDDSRNIELTGEGYFKVAHDAEKPFTVKSEGISVKVLGTEFNLKSSKEGALLAVIEGTVQVTSLNKVIQLEKKQMVVTSLKDNLMTRSSISDMNFLSWKTGIMSFVHKPLNDILIQMENHYHAHIDLSAESLGACSVSVTLQGLSLEESLDVLATLLNGTVTKKDESYVLMAAPCQN